MPKFARLLDHQRAAAAVNFQLVLQFSRLNYRKRGGAGRAPGELGIGKAQQHPDAIVGSYGAHGAARFVRTLGDVRREHAANITDFRVQQPAKRINRMRADRPERAADAVDAE